MTVAPAPHGPLPSLRQLHWHAMEFYGFIHFSVNTFTDREWGYGDESPSVFHPSALDARQWARVAQDAGMRGLILTAKHHDGFCLWPSQWTDHSVKSSPWKEGTGDVLREFSEACREVGLKVGLYLSPWDRHHPEYGRPQYIDYYRRQLDELLTQYGELFEIWFDGANGGDGYYGGARETRTIDQHHYYGFPELWEMVRRRQPQAILFSDAGPDIRWIGNEGGQASHTCWARMFPDGIAPGKVDDPNRLGWGEPDGTIWRPAEVDVSLRPGWFYHPEEHPKTLQQLLDIYLASIGRGTSLLLNLSPDRRGLIPEEDVARLVEFRQVRDAMFANDLARGKPATASHVRGNDPRFAASHATDGNPESYWAVDDDICEASITVELPEAVPVNHLRIEEYIPLGQRIEFFSIEVRFWQGQWLEVAVGTTIGPQRIVSFPTIKADQIRLHIRKAQACPLIRQIAVYEALVR